MSQFTQRQSEKLLNAKDSMMPYCFFSRMKDIKIATEYDDLRSLRYQYIVMRVLENDRIKHFYTLMFVTIVALSIYLYEEVKFQSYEIQPNIVDILEEILK